MKEQREPLLRVNISHFPPPFEPHCEGLARGFAPALPSAAGRGCGARRESCGAVQVDPCSSPEPAASRSCRFHGSGLTGQSPRAAAGGRGIETGTFVCGVCPAPRCRRRRSSPVTAEVAREEAEVRSRGRRGCGGRKKTPGIICKSHKSRGRVVGEGQRANEHRARGASRGPLQGAAAAVTARDTQTRADRHMDTRGQTRSVFTAAESGTTPTRRAGPAEPARHWRGGSRPLTFHPPHPRLPLPLLPRLPSYPQSPAPAALVPRSSLPPPLPLPPFRPPRHSGKTRGRRRLPREAPGRDRGVPVAAAVTAGWGRGRGGLGRV